MTPIPPGPIAVLDANVLHSGALRDFLMNLASVLAYQPRWTERIHQEWQNSVLKRYKHLTLEKVEYTRQRMDESFHTALVAGYETTVHAFFLPDENDRHILAAAVACGAEYIVTQNLKDFPPSLLRPYGVIPIHPDDFAVLLFEQSPETIIFAVKSQRAELTRPAKNVAEHLATLYNCGLKQIVTRLRPYADQL
jgi:predicted nucleic acid-binding protein